MLNEWAWKDALLTMSHGHINRLIAVISIISVIKPRNTRIFYSYKLLYSITYT